MATLTRAIFCSIGLIFLMSVTGMAQQSQPASINELKEQIAKLEEINRAPTTTLEVRNLNRTFLDSRRAELRSLLMRRRESLRAYLSSNRSILKAEEVRSIEDSIRAVEADLANLAAANPAAAGGLADSTTASGRETRTRTTTSSEDSLPGVTDTLPPQTPCPANPNDLISSVVVRTGRVTRTGAPLTTLEIELSVPLSLTNQPSDVTVVTDALRIPASHFKVTAQGASTSVNLTVADVTAADTDALIIPVTGAIPAGATKVNVTITGLAFECPSENSPTLIGAASKEGNISTNEALKKSDLAALNQANKAAAAKRSDEKNFRMGFNAAKGDGEKADGAADISINKTIFGGGERTGSVLDFFDQADISFQTKKSSAEKTDARQMVLGLGLQKTFLIDARVTDNDVGRMTRAQAERNRRRKGLFRVLNINEALNLEGEAFDFKTSNFVSDTNFELSSIAKKIGSGYYNLHIFGGPELGRNLSKPDAATTVGATAAQLSRVDWITRLKAGGEFALRLLPSASGDQWGLEFSAAFVNRTLFNSEVFTENTTDAGENKIKTVSIGKGNKAYRQANLKVFLFGNERARYGVNLSYMNGRLPPAFAPTRGFQFGLLVESTDDKKSGEAANTNK